MDFPENLRRLMQRDGITMYRLSREVGVHQTTIKNWLDSESEPKINMLTKLFYLFHVSYDELLGEPEPAGYVDHDVAYYHSHVNQTTLVTFTGHNTAVIPDMLLQTCAGLNKKGLQTLCDIAEGLSHLPAYQDRQREGSA